MKINQKKVFFYYSIFINQRIRQIGKNCGFSIAEKKQCYDLSNYNKFKMKTAINISQQRKIKINKIYSGRMICHLKSIWNFEIGF